MSTPPDPAVVTCEHQGTTDQGATVDTAPAVPVDPSLAEHLVRLLRQVADQVEREQPVAFTASAPARIVDLGDPDGCGRLHRELGVGFRSASFEIQWDV